MAHCDPARVSSYLAYSLNHKRVSVHRWNGKTREHFAFTEKEVETLNEGRLIVSRVLENKDYQVFIVHDPHEFLFNQLGIFSLLMQNVPGCIGIAMDTYPDFDLELVYPKSATAALRKFRDHSGNCHTDDQITFQISDDGAFENEVRVKMLFL